MVSEADSTEMSSTTSSTLLLRCQEGEVTSEDTNNTEQKIDAEATGMLEVALPRVLSASKATAEAIEAACGKQQENCSSERSQDLQDEVLNFPTNCPDCAAPAETKMKLTSKLICLHICLYFYSLNSKSKLI